MPVMHRNVTYNCRVAFYNGQIIIIRPKVDYVYWCHVRKCLQLQNILISVTSEMMNSIEKILLERVGGILIENYTFGTIS